MKIGDEDDKPNVSRIHCDYATARDDQYEYECMQRALEREMRHQQRLLEDMNREPSPPPIARYTENEATHVTEMLKCMSRSVIESYMYHNLTRMCRR